MTVKFAVEQVQIQNQQQKVKHEIMQCLNGGMKNKQEIYTIVSTKTDTPRPTVRRVASALKKELEKHHQVLSSTKHAQYVAAEYDCSGCGAKRVIKKLDKRCPKCQVVLDWSDE